MPINHSMDRRSKGLSRILIAITLVLIAALIAGAVVASLNKESEPAVGDKEALSARVEAGFPEAAENVTDAFLLWGFPSFNRNTVFNVEACYHNSYYKELPSNEELGMGAARVFLEKYYDKIDLTDKVAVSHGLANSFISAVGDKYGRYRTKAEQAAYTDSLSGSMIGIGVMIRATDDKDAILVSSTVANSPAAAAGILAQDKIIAVDGVRVSEVGYDAASNLISGAEGTQVTLLILRGGEELSISVTRAKIDDRFVYYEMLEGNVGYISIDRFVSPTAEQFAEAMDALEADGAEAIIFDLRSNPGGLLASVVSVLSYIAPSGTELVSFSPVGSPIYASDGKGHELFDHVYTMPSVILVNGATASAGELFTAAMRDFCDWGYISVTVMGSTTYGKGVMQSGVSFSDGSALSLTTAQYNPPSGTNFDGVGVTPDIELAEGSDQVAQALAHLLDLLSEQISA